MLGDMSAFQSVSLRDWIQPLRVACRDLYFFYPDETIFGDRIFPVRAWLEDLCAGR